MASKKILLFGKTGQLGSKLLLKLNQFDIIGLDYPEVDFNNPSSLRKIISAINPALIINAAAYTAVDLAEAEKEKAYNINAYSLEEIASAANSLNASLIHFSTDYVFDGNKGSLYQESDNPNPINVYGDSKLLGEQIVLNSGVPHIIFRLSWVYSTTHPSFLRSILGWVRKHETLRIVDDQISNPTSAEMVAQEIVALIDTGKRNWREFIQKHAGIYHLVNQGSVTRYDWAKAIIELDPNPAEHKTKEILRAKSSDFETAAPRPPFSGLDGSKYSTTFLRELPNWKSSLAEELLKTKSR